MVGSIIWVFLKIYFSCLAVKEFWKFVKNWQGYCHEFGVLLFWDTVYIHTYIKKIYTAPRIGSHYALRSRHTNVNRLAITREKNTENLNRQLRSQPRVQTRESKDLKPLIHYNSVYSSHWPLCCWKNISYLESTRNLVIPNRSLPHTSSWPHLRCDVGLEEGEYKWKLSLVLQYCVLL